MQPKLQESGETQPVLTEILRDPKRGDMIHYRGLGGLRLYVCGRRSNQVLLWFNHSGGSADQGIMIEDLSQFQAMEKGVASYGLQNALRNINVAGFISKEAAQRWENGEDNLF